MKILQINSVEGVGSTGRIASGLQTVVSLEGHLFINAYGRKTNKTSDNLKIGDAKDIFYHVVLTRLLDKHGFGSKLATKQFIKKIKELNPDIIHMQNIHGYYINIEELFNFLKIYNKPIIWSLHDCWAFTGHCSHFEYKNCEKWKTQCFDCPEKKAYPSSIIVDNSRMNFKIKKKLFQGITNLTIVTGSKWLDDKLSFSFLNEYPRVNIPTGIDLSKFRIVSTNFKKKYNIENKFMILGVASVWGQRKGLDQFIKLSKLISEDEVIVLVGVSIKERKLLPDNVISIEKTDSIDGLVDIYNAADVFVNLTLEDTFPTTNIESQACGTPVITYNTGGSPESIGNNCGYVVPKFDIQNIYKKIKVIKSKGKKSYTVDCEKNALNYDMHIRYKEYLELYKGVLGGPI